MTLVAAEHLAAIAAYLGLESVAPERLRRNLVVSGLNLLALKGRRFRLGDAVLEHSGECHPCSRMEDEFGPGGYNAVRGHGGITARVLEGGDIRLGDAPWQRHAAPDVGHAQYSGKVCWACKSGPIRRRTAGAGLPFRRTLPP